MDAARSIPRVVIAGTASGVGKTSIVVGLCRALAARGLRVAVFKAGPDYLDPTYHRRASGAPCHNLDGWMMGRQAVRETFAAAAAGADLALVEGVMGLHDGASPRGPEGSTAELARWLDAPVVLVVDAGGMARSLAALVQGFARFDPELRLAGVIANRVGSAGHAALLAEALRAGGAPALLGGLPERPALAFPARHLGLRTADERAVPEAALDAWGGLCAEHLGLDALLALARDVPPIEAPARASATLAAPRCRLALADDEAFHFYYEHNLRALRAAGAELVRFSPLGDAAPPPCDGMILGGGYPEVHAAALAANAPMRDAIRALADAGAPIYAECGGLMYLAHAIVDAAGARHAMVGLVPGVAVVQDRLAALGYVEVETQAPTPLGGPGVRFRGHQFRYSRLELAGAVATSYRVRRRRDPGTVSDEGYAPRPNVLASWVHVHFASNPGCAPALVDAAARFAAARAEGRS